MTMFTDDPVRDAERYAAEQEEALACLPVCDICDEPIQQEHFYEINDTKICEHCLNEYYRKETCDYVG